MFETTCLDENGNTVYSMTQWDINQNLIIDVSNLSITTAPKVHFCNEKSIEALPVESTLSNNKVTAPIPITLLKEPYPIIAYIYVANAGASSTQKTVACVKIPMNKRVRPGNYIYSDDVELIYLNDKISEVNTIVTKIESFNIDTKISQMNSLITQYNSMIASFNDAKTYLA